MEYEMPGFPKKKSVLLCLVILAAGTTILSADPVRAQRDVNPSMGGTTYELGMPPIYKGRSGFETGWYRPKTISELNGYLNLGVAKDLGSPVVGIGALRLEGYLGFSNQDLRGGGRALFEVPSFYFGAGVDYDAKDEVLDGLFTLDLPLRRGGIFGRGTTLAVRWLPSRDQTFSLGINTPLWGRNIGATRPARDSVQMTRRNPARLEIDPLVHELADALDRLRERARWVTRLSQPFAEQEGADPRQAMAPVLDELTAHLVLADDSFPQGHTLPLEIEAYHLTLNQAFTAACGGDAATGELISARAREYLLDQVLVPYDALLGQRKDDDSLVGMIAVAQTGFAAWLLTSLDLPEENVRQVAFVFQTLCDITEDLRAELRQRWVDSRFVWLPLQLALTPEQHDTQGELNDIIAQLTRQEFTPANRVWYVINEEFQWEMARSVRLAENYHVLWIHDFRGRNGQGDPDAIAYAHTLNYLEALIERVQAIDTRGTMPQYFLLLDQHYFEINKSRLWLRLLHDPLNYQLSLPGELSEWEENIRQAQERLRQAVDQSVLLQLATSQYGRPWLENQVKVHINITNPADTSFWSWHIAGILPIPDNMMRDHRKIAFYDVTEADPYKGLAMFTGMGIGEHYVGANWEDRAIMIQGPGALAVKDAARGLLKAQGFAPEEIPFSLREVDKAPDYRERLVREAAPQPLEGFTSLGQVLQLHNETGFHDKPINAAKAALYSLMPPGSVLEVPDSLWQNYVYASLLAGSSLRGCRVLVIAPTEKSAPSGAPPTLARAHGLMGRLIVFSEAMGSHLDRQGGLLKVGLYAPRQGVGDIAGRLRQARKIDLPWLRKVFPENPAVSQVSSRALATMDSLGYRAEYLAEKETKVQPKIHMKANFLASGTAWDALITRPELADVVHEYIGYLASQAYKKGDTSHSPDVRDFPEKLAENWSKLIVALLEDLTPAQREDLVYFFTVGSTNMDYRSMVMDGEVMVVTGGWQSLYGFLDFLLLPGLCEWVETTDQLDELLPPPSGMTRGLAGLMKLSL
jgi:hypothetical protein